MKDVTSKYRPNSKDLRGRRKDKAFKKLTERRVRKESKVDPNQMFD